jgi:hypothetical protein
MSGGDGRKHGINSSLEVNTRGRFGPSQQAAEWGLIMVIGGGLSLYQRMLVTMVRFFISVNRQPETSFGHSTIFWNLSPIFGYLSPQLPSIQSFAEWSLGPTLRLSHLCRYQRRALATKRLILSRAHLFLSHSRRVRGCGCG